MYSAIHRDARLPRLRTPNLLQAGGVTSVLGTDKSMFWSKYAKYRNIMQDKTITLIISKGTGMFTLEQATNAQTGS